MKFQHRFEEVDSTTPNGVLNHFFARLEGFLLHLVFRNRKKNNTTNGLTLANMIFSYDTIIELYKLNLLLLRKQCERMRTSKF